MADRIARPPIRLSGGLPDGHHNGTVEVAKHFLDLEPDDRFAIVRVGRHQLIHDDETDADVAVLKVRAIEFHSNQQALQELLQTARGDRVGQLPLDEPDPAWDELEALRSDLDNWRIKQGLSGVDYGQRWADVMGDQDDPNTTVVSRLREFALTVGAIDDPRRDKPEAD